MWFNALVKAREGDTQVQFKPTGAPRGAGGRSGGGSGRCPSCKAVVPAKPGFRLSTLKCPRCGTPVGKR